MTLYLKIVTPREMARIEALAYSEGESEKSYMEKAGKGVAEVAVDFAKQNHLEKKFLLLCGKGNNAGDAYVAGIELIEKGFKGASLQILPLKETTPLCQHYAQKFSQIGGTIYGMNECSEDLFNAYSLMLDGVFGTGFRGTLQEPYATVIRMANDSKKFILAIDIPSGLNGETGKVETNGILATQTIFLSLPKLGFFLEDGWNYVGKLRRVDFGLPSKYIEQATASMGMIDKDCVSSLLPPIVRKRHKYQAGYVVGLSGSPGMPGAAMLASLACLRGGAGIVRLLHPEGMQSELTNSPYELIRHPYQQNKNDVKERMNLATATFMGPGLGRTEAVDLLLRSLIPQLTKPCVIDADALHFIAKEEIDLPKETILTPHRGEMLTLLNEKDPPLSDLDWIEVCKDYAKKKNVTLILKGGPTFIFSPSLYQPEKTVLVNLTGDPGMATAGSGDVLTGLLTSLLAQGLSCYQAAVLGVFLHGLAGEYAAKDKSSYAMIASDIIDRFSDAFKHLQSKRS